VNDVTAVAGFVVPGTRVDVLLTDIPGGINEQRTITVLENVAVLAAGQRLERNSVEEPQNAAVFTLLVSPQDAEKLTLASSQGHIQLMLRNRLDQKQPMQRDTPLKPIPPKIPPSLRVKPIPPEIPLSPRLRSLT
jgi:pilus assembly protein CpaB